MKYGIALGAMVLATTVLLASCVEPTPVQSTVEASNSGFDAVLLFVDDDGCKIKRFYDGRKRYYAVCPTNLQASTNASHNCGKSCTSDEQIPTVRR